MCGLSWEEAFVITVACVLKTGGLYDVEWVYALGAGLYDHLGHPGVDFEFVCLTDDDIRWAWAVPLQHGWPGWWSKIELFRPGLFGGPVLYLDLDTLVLGDLSEIVSYDGPFAMLSDFYRPKVAQSGVMMWTPSDETAAIYETVRADEARILYSYRGDGEFLHDQLPSADRIQDLCPGQVVSYKVHARQGPPENARLVCAHGPPKWNDPAAGWAYHRWMSLV